MDNPKDTIKNISKRWMTNNEKGRKVKEILRHKFENSRSLQDLQDEAWDTIHQAVGLYFIEQDNADAFVNSFEDTDKARAALSEAQRKQDIAFNSVIQISPN